MTELEMEALYERAIVGDEAAIAEMIVALGSSDECVTEFTVWGVMELIDGNVFSAEQVDAVESASWGALTDVARKWLSKSIECFRERQPCPCERCGELEDCRCIQIDADNWKVYRRRWC